MNTLFIFILGLLVGWLIEWLIDYFYWRRRYAEQEVVPAHMAMSESRVAPVNTVESRPAVKATPDNLKIIKGIGPVIERKLNDAGIYTFEELGNLSVANLRRILGNAIERLSDEEALLRQARDLAHRK